MTNEWYHSIKNMNQCKCALDKKSKEVAKLAARPITKTGKQKQGKEVKL